MTTLAIQKRIISKRKETKNNSFLESIYKLLNLSKEADEVLTLSTIQKTGIRKGLKDIELARTVSHAKAKKEVAKWLSK